MNFKADPPRRGKKKTVARKKLLINEQKEGLSIVRSFQTLKRHEMLNAYSFNPQIFVVGQTLF